MSTKKLAKELGLLRQRSNISSSGSKKSLLSNQTFSYLIVIDFESTCWREKNNHTQEIIEFPAVLLNTSSGEVESEFHTYVQPQEHPILSRFCTELTGITQLQVEAGIPLQICLSRFCRWLQNLQLEKGVVFPNKQRCSAPAPVPLPSQKLCTFLTWSDWDLGVCLQYECKRKQLHKPDVLNSWIDLRSTYRLFYSRKPKGLNGALQDLGIQFSGREHSGLDDARNTAQLAVRMMRDGCVMKITRSLERTPAVIKPIFGNATADKRKEKPNTKKEENMLTTNKPSSSKNLKSCQIKLCSENNTLNLDTKENSHSIQESVQICKSLITPKTLLNGTNTPLWGRSRGPVTSEAIANLSSAVMLNNTSPHNNKSLVLCSTTLGCLSHLPHPNLLSKSRATVAVVEDEQGEELLVEEEERCGSYDDVVLEGDDVINEADHDTEYISDFDSGCYVWEDPDYSRLKEGRVPLRDNISAENNSTTSDLSRASVSTKEKRMDQLNRMKQHSVISEPDAYFAVPKAVTWGSRTNRHEIGLEASLRLREKSDRALQNLKTNTLSLRHKPFVPEKTSTPNTTFSKPKPVITQNKKHQEVPKSSFTIYTEPAKRTAAPSRSSLHNPKSVLGSLSARTLSSLTNRSFTSLTTKGQKITSPLCACGRRAKRQVVSNGGPNHGRGFFCCPVRRSGNGGRVQKGCEFFKWESSLMKSSLVVYPTVGSSVSLCQISSTLNCRPQQRSTLRKSC